VHMPREMAAQHGVELQRLATAGAACQACGSGQIPRPEAAPGKGWSGT
jgi:hypothetical protein